NVGQYAINGSGLTANNGNYTFQQAPANATALTINPAVLTYVADPQSRSYGSPNPTLTGTVTGFMLSDTLAHTTTGTHAFAPTPPPLPHPPPSRSERRPVRDHRQRPHRQQRQLHLPAGARECHRADDQPGSADLHRRPAEHQLRHAQPGADGYGDRLRVGRHA